jgi:acetylornithine/succinyldiaminopimelate/putrescine aminotransferase
VVCAGALAVIDVIESEGLLDRAGEIFARLSAALTAAAEPTGLVTDVRGRGCLIGVQLSAPVSHDLVLGLIEQGVLATTAGPDVLRMSPALITTDEELDDAAGAFGRVVHDLMAARA